MANDPRFPPVLSRQVSRPIVLPTRATPLKHIPVISNAGHAQAPVRLAGGRGSSSPHIPTAEDMISTLQPTTDKGPAGTPIAPAGGVVIHAEGTNNIGGSFGAGPLPLCSATFDRPRALTIYVAIRPGIDAGGGFQVPGNITLLATVRLGRGRAATRFNVDIPIFGNTAGAGYNRSPVVAIPVVAENVDVSMRYALFGWGLSNALWVANVLPPAQQDNIFDDPPPLTPAQTPSAIIPVTAWVGEEESTPRFNYPFRRVTSILDASGGATPSMTIPICMGVDRVSLLSDAGATPVAQPAVTYAFIGPGAVGTIAGLLPNQEPLVVPGQCHQIKVSNSDAGNPHNFCLIQYGSL